MLNFNSYPYDSKEYHEEELKQQTLIAELVGEAIQRRIIEGNQSNTLEDLSAIFLRVIDCRNYSKQKIANFDKEGK